MEDNLSIYNASRAVPKEALKEIKGGRLSGMTDINPMWRMKKLTELFGPCGIGWKYEITKQWIEHGADGNVSAFVNINLYIKDEREWSEAIPGTGGSSFIAKERAGLYTSDECFKMALTDAISVSCKALGFGADVYWNADTTKYNARSDQPKQRQQQKTSQLMSEEKWQKFWEKTRQMGYELHEVEAVAGMSAEDICKFSPTQATELFKKLSNKSA